MGAKLQFKRDKDDILYWGNKGAIMVGKFANTAGNGIKLSSDRTGALKVHGDDGGVIKASGTYRPIQGRMLLTAVHTAGTFAGIHGQIKHMATGTASTPDWAVGIWGYAEAQEATQTVKNLFGVRATVDIPTGVTIASGGVVAGLTIDSIDLGGTHTGKASCIFVPAPGDGAWDYFLDITAQTNIAVANTHAIDSHALAFYLKVRMGTTDGYIPCLAAVPS